MIKITVFHRLYRGGSWGSDVDRCGINRRNVNYPGLRGNNLGIRVIRLQKAKEEVK